MTATQLALTNDTPRLLCDAIRDGVCYRCGSTDDVTFDAELPHTRVPYCAGCRAEMARKWRGKV